MPKKDMSWALTLFLECGFTVCKRCTIGTYPMLHAILHKGISMCSNWKSLLRLVLSMWFHMIQYLLYGGQLCIFRSFTSLHYDYFLATVLEICSLLSLFLIFVWFVTCLYIERVIIYLKGKYCIWMNVIASGNIKQSQTTNN